MNKNKNARATVAVLGAGIMGSSVALYLARMGVNVKLFDQADRPFTGASRWNEGKIHLGYLYGADPSLKTARKLIPGGLAFPALVSDLVGRQLGTDMVTNHNDRYLIHRDSVVAPEEAFALATKVALLCEQHEAADSYFVPLKNAMPRRLSVSEYNTEHIVAGFEVPERSVSTNRIADYYVEALQASQNIKLVMGLKVAAVQQKSAGGERWFVDTLDAAGEKNSFGPYDSVVNTLWEGALAVDATVGLLPPLTWTHRYRLSLFAKCKQPVKLNSAVIGFGPFGDIKNYDGRHLYISWYDSGLLSEGHDLHPPVVHLPGPDAELNIVKEKLSKLGSLIPGVSGLLAHFESYSLKGGWVYAAGQGALSDRQSDLHRRDKAGLSSKGRYYSVDTGKYSIAPLLARKLVDELVNKL